MNENELSNAIIGLAIKVHSALGPGLLESAYEECLFYEIQKAGLLVEKKLILKLKSVEVLNDVHFAQLLTYLKLSRCKLGLLINFNVARLKDGIKRVINS